MEDMGIPPGVVTHFAPVKDLLGWLQVPEIPLSPHILLTRVPVPLLHSRLSCSCRDDSKNEEHQPTSSLFPPQFFHVTINNLSSDAASSSRLQVRSQRREDD